MRKARLEDIYPSKDGYLYVSWKHLYGNKFHTTISKAMLEPGGYTIFRPARLIGQSHKEEPALCYVTFDREYVVTKLALHLSGLQDIGFNECQKLVGEAWQIAKNSTRDNY